MARCLVQLAAGIQVLTALPYNKSMKINTVHKDECFCLLGPNHIKG